ncbi:MAG: hypothetical protein IJW19_06025 [Clostridia bacterium]|nr:hypothetical protein [Clostridia bacterium]
MDKFSRTTEIDTAGVLNAIEQDTPKKSRRGNIIALIICILAAIFIWAYVTDTDATIDEKEYRDINVSVESSQYNVEVKTVVNVTLKGTKSDLVDVKRSEIKIVVSADQIHKEGEYKVPITCYLDDAVNADVEIIPSTGYVTVSVKKK